MVLIKYTEGRLRGLFMPNNDLLHIKDKKQSDTQMVVFDVPFDVYDNYCNNTFSRILIMVEDEEYFNSIITYKAYFDVSTHGRKNKKDISSKYKEIRMDDEDIDCKYSNCRECIVISDRLHNSLQNKRVHIYRTCSKRKMIHLASFNSSLNELLDMPEEVFSSHVVKRNKLKAVSILV